MKKKKILKHPINVLLDDKLHISLKIITDKLEINFSDYLRNALKEKLEKDLNK